MMCVYDGEIHILLLNCIKEAVVTGNRCQIF